jgi:hypothetical protein
VKKLMNSPPLPPLCSAKRGCKTLNYNKVPPLYEVERGIKGIALKLRGIKILIMS